MYSWHNPAWSRDWLYQIERWSRNQEHDIRELEGTTHEPEQIEQLVKWQEEFAQLRKNVKKHRNASTHDIALRQSHEVIPHLLQQSHRLHYFFSRFLQDRLRETRASTASRSIEESANDGEYAHIQGEKGKEVHFKPVPIGEHTLPPLPYPYDALEPYIDEKTMRLHHDKHHKSYVEGLNKAEREMAKARRSGDFSLIKHWEREAAFHGAGHYLHTIFWHNMSPHGGGMPTDAIAREMKRTFGSLQQFKRHFSAAAENVEGGGWALLVWAPRSHRVEILQAEKHQNLSQQDAIPLLVLDVWEHAYYLKYNNNRKKYIEAWWHVVNWDNVNHRYKEARQVTWKPY